MLELNGAMQKGDYDCGAACVDTVIRYYGIRTSVAFLDLANPIQGLSPDSIEALCRKAGLSILSGTMTTDDLQHLTKRERPVLCPITTPEGGHWIVVRGVARGRVYFHDPADGPRSLKLADWSAGWRDTSRAGHEYDRWGICAYLG